MLELPKFSGANPFVGSLKARANSPENQFKVPLIKKRLQVTLHEPNVVALMKLFDLALQSKHV